MTLTKKQRDEYMRLVRSKVKAMTGDCKRAYVMGALRSGDTTDAETNNRLRALV